MWDVLLDALIDTLILFPFLFALYVLIEVMEHNTQVSKPRLLSGRFAPLVGAASGIVPMCGFSVMAAKLYRHRHITVGTLIAVLIATSDEGLLVLLLSPLPWLEKLYTIAALCGSKLLLGAGLGYLADFFVSRTPLVPIPQAHGEAHDHLHEEEHTHEEEHAEDCACGELSACEHKKKGALMLYLASPLLHALQVAAFVLIVNVLFGTLFFGLGGGDEEAGADVVASFMSGAAYWWQPLLCALVGVIPNCASSVILAEAYALGGIGFGGLFSGLFVNAGLGYLILLGKGRRKSGALILLVLFVLALVFGYLAGAVEYFAF